jgi:hypothetical protein
MWRKPSAAEEAASAAGAVALEPAGAPVVEHVLVAEEHPAPAAALEFRAEAGREPAAALVWEAGHPPRALRNQRLAQRQDLKHRDPRPARAT